MVPHMASTPTKLVPVGTRIEAETQRRLIEQAESARRSVAAEIRIAIEAHVQQFERDRNPAKAAA